MVQGSTLASHGEKVHCSPRARTHSACSCSTGDIWPAGRVLTGATVWSVALHTPDAADERQPTVLLSLTASSSLVFRVNSTRGRLCSGPAFWSPGETGWAQERLPGSREGYGVWQEWASALGSEQLQSRGFPPHFCRPGVSTDPRTTLDCIVVTPTRKAHDHRGVDQID
ncbi:hypothetical protein H920_07439 [Fukomys damarensis]|uniref:Uncharacterized protein n=1 Tax=Fukomys damarensis TaxID=885580 RepID=A0A091DLK2_FUKDA|nr:hypothetical protein H920_07439 [Fukomys damarensis]